MDVILLVKKEHVDEDIDDIAREIIIPFVESLPKKLQAKAGIYCLRHSDFGRETTVYATTDPELGLDPTFLGKEGVFVWEEELGRWRWTSNQSAQAVPDKL